MFVTSYAVTPEDLMAAEVSSRHRDALRHSASRWRFRRGSLSVRRGDGGRTSRQSTPTYPIA